MATQPARGGTYDAREQMFMRDFEKNMRAREANMRARAYKNAPLRRLEEEQLAHTKLYNTNSDTTRSKFVDVDQCQLSYGHNDDGTPKGPWHPATAAQFASAQNNRPKGDINYNLVRDPRDSTYKILRTRDKKYCVRDKPKDSKLPDLLKTVERIERIASKLKIGRKDKQKELQQAWREKSNQRLASFDRLMRINTHGNKVDFEPSTDYSCGMSGGNGKAWNVEFGTPTNPTKGGLDPSAYEKNQVKSWYRPWLIDNGKDEPYCAAEDSDAPLAAPGTYHDLGALRNVTKNDKPETSRGFAMPDGQLYQEAMFCSQQPDKENCTSPDEKQVPLGGTASPGATCKWYGKSKIDGQCMPDYIYRKRAVGQRKAYGEDPLSQWYKNFAKNEQKMQSEYGIFGPSTAAAGRRFTGETKQSAMWKKMTK